MIQLLHSITLIIGGFGLFLSGLVLFRYGSLLIYANDVKDRQVLLLAMMITSAFVFVYITSIISLSERIVDHAVFQWRDVTTLVLYAYIALINTVAVRSMHLWRPNEGNGH